MVKPNDKRHSIERARRQDAAFEHLYSFGFVAWEFMKAVLPKRCMEADGTLGAWADRSSRRYGDSAALANCRQPA